MEKWAEVFAGQIPKGNYEMLLQNGEKEGLKITLSSPAHKVILAFGAVSAVSMLDEGIALNDLFDNEQIETFRGREFDNTIYQMTDGELDRFVQKAAGELYNHLDLKHYVIISMNYIVEVITQWGPDIYVSNN